MTVDVTKPLEVVALEGADEPEGTCWDAEYSEKDSTARRLDIRFNGTALFFRYSGECLRPFPHHYRLRNKATSPNPDNWHVFNANGKHIHGEAAYHIVDRAEAEARRGKGQWSPEFRERVEALLRDIPDNLIGVALATRKTALLAELQPPVDPLVDVVKVLGWDVDGEQIDELHAELAERGLAITELAKQADNG